MGVKISSISDVGVARELPSTFVPRQAARDALRRTSYVNGLAVSESGMRNGCTCGRCSDCRPMRLNGLGELVQVVT